MRIGNQRQAYYNMKKVYITDASCYSSLGNSLCTTYQAIEKGQSGIKHIAQLDYITDFYAGKIDHADLNCDWEALGIQGDYTRFEKMLILALKPIIDKKKPTASSVLVLATTKGNIASLPTKGISESDLNLVAQRMAALFGFSTQPIIVCNACVSGILAVSIAKRMLQMNEYTDAYVLGGDELTSFVVSGFNSFQAMSSEPCKPFDANRTGVTLGEASAAAYLSTETSTQTYFEIKGESSIADANHISGPSRTGEGLYQSIQNALREAALLPEDIDLVSAHGTATNYNDEMESFAFSRASLAHKPMHSLKGYFGHTLGAAGLLELVVVMESMKHNELIISKGFETLGVSNPLNIITAKHTQPLAIALKTASGFGGSNTAIIIEKKSR